MSEQIMLSWLLGVCELIKKTIMKNYKILFATLVMFLGISNMANAQHPDLSFKHDPSLFIGKWEAKQGNNSYELIIIKGQFEINREEHLVADLLLGEIVYKQGNEVVRHLKTEENNAMFCIFGQAIDSPVFAKFYFNDFERNVKGEGEFVIDKNDHSKAKWTLQKRANNGKTIIVNGKKPAKLDFDIPTNLQWRKIE
jgi:hypothetical protein